MKNIVGFILFTALLFFSCSTEKNKWVNRTYHNTTAYYNGYFNAREIIKEENKIFEKSRSEDYSKVLPVNRYPNEEEAKNWESPMEISIEKVSKVIQKHAMPREKKGKYARVEWGNWMDENWLVLGKSNFYKRSYPEAIETFEYVAKMYEQDPSKYHAKLWLAKTYIEMGEYSEANIYLKEIVNEKELGETKEERKEATEERRKRYKSRKRRSSSIKVVKGREKKKEEESIIVPFPEKLTHELVATIADFHVRKGEYEEGLIMLDSAYNLARRRKDKVRYKFIEAQIHQQLGEKSQAYDSYSYVIKRTAPYQMTFYAKINRALLANGSNRKALKKDLLKLARDDKYIEFRDQIYYALAEIELQDNDKPEAITYLQKSAAAPPSNETQKGKTYIKLADLYFMDKAYVQAQKYYDSSLTSLPNTYPNYENIKEKSVSLTDLVKHLNNIKLQDSLQQIAKLDDKKRLDKIEEILYAQKIEEERIKQEKALQQNNQVTQNNIVANNNSKGQFWMYNEQTKAYGFKEFKSTWGDITLEDNWRRSNKSKSLIAQTQEPTSDAPIVSDKEIDEFLARLPLDDKALMKSNEEILTSLYFSGLIYKDKLNDLPEAINSFNEAMTRFFPTNDNVVGAMYQLYKSYKQKGNLSQAEDVKQKIISTYPKSEEAKILKDPNYISNQQNQNKSQENEYNQIYTLIENNNNTQAVTKIDAVLSKNDGNPYACQLRFLKAKAYGNMQQMDQLQIALKDVIDNCKTDPVGPLAEEALKKLNQLDQEKEKQNAREKLFTFDPGAPHFLVILVPNGSFDLYKMKARISNFNKANFNDKGLKTSQTFLEKETQTVLVKQFSDKAEAIAYLKAYKANTKELKEFNSEYEAYVVSASNYSSLFVSKDLEKYKEFYDLNYR